MRCKKILISYYLFFAASILCLCQSPDGTRPDTFSSEGNFLDYIQMAHLNYMWDGAEKTSGLALERIHPNENRPLKEKDIVTTGGSGFGIMGLIVGIERGFIDRTEGVQRLSKIVDFLINADRYHGVWPHWINGSNGKTVKFGEMDDGGDLVESSFLMQGLLCARQYFINGNQDEKTLVAKINRLWHEMEFSFYQQDGKDVLFWHWSPKYKWEINFPLEGYNECLIVYILGASSPTYPISPDAYHTGWARDGDIVSNAAPYRHKLYLKHNFSEENGGPLFWAHYSYTGFSPKGTKDKYADYWEVTRNHALANYDYCVDNPKHFKEYGKDCWGLTSSYSPSGYSTHAPNNDIGVITPTAALSSFPYTPKESMRALKYFYFTKGDILWGKYGFYDFYCPQDDWCADAYLAIDQCTIAPMIENFRTALLWNLFMSAPEIQDGLTRLGFTYKKVPCRY